MARTDNNSFVRADEPNADRRATSPTADARRRPPRGLPQLYDALYATALDSRCRAPLIDQLIRIFAYDVDYQARISPGD